MSGGPLVTAAKTEGSPRKRLAAAALQAGVYFSIGYYLCQAAFLIADQVRTSMGFDPPPVRADVLRRELIEVGGLSEETADLVMAAAAKRPKTDAESKT